MLDFFIFVTILIPYFFNIHFLTKKGFRFRIHKWFISKREFYALTVKLANG